MRTKRRFFCLNSSTAIDTLQPSEFYLGQNYPNPFSDTTSIKFCVAYRTRVTLEVTDMEGKLIRTLLDEEKDTGTYEIECDASTLLAGGRGPSEGIYVYMLHAGEFSAAKRMLLISHRALPYEATD
jgi:hypothetical protein